MTVGDISCFFTSYYVRNVFLPTVVMNDL